MAKKMDTKIPGFFTTSEAAQYLGLARITIQKHCERGNLAALKADRDLLIPAAELMRFEKTRRPVGNPKWKKDSKP